MKRRNNLLTVMAIALGFVMIEGAGNEAAADYCKPGYKMYKSKNGKNWCCPPGTKGYYDGYTKIRCRRNSGTSPYRGRINTSGVRFRYVKRHDQGKWYKYAIRLNAPQLASRVRWVEYQRQDNTFPEFKQRRYLRRTKGPDFLIWWKGYSNVPIAIRVRFDNGRTHYHRITRSPTLLSSSNRNKSSCRPGYKGYVAKSGRVLCCPPGTKGYYRGHDDIVCKQASSKVATHNCQPGYRGFKGRNGQVWCCPPGTRGYLKGTNEVICKATASTENKTTTTTTPPPKADCKPGWGLYLARSGKKHCCPPGKTGHLRGYSRVVCK